MIAIIKDENNKKYVSKVFGIKDGKNRWFWIALNKDKTHIVIIEENTDEKRKIFNLEEERWTCKNDKWQGLDWVINDNTLIQELESNKSVSIEDYPQFKEYTKEIKLPEWFEIKTQKDIDDLMCASFNGFHDAFYEDKDFIRQGLDIQITFQSCWGISVIIKFIDVIEEFKMDELDEILDSSITINQEYICWMADCSYDKNREFMENPPYIKCKRLLWHLETIDE